MKKTMTIQTIIRISILLTFSPIQCMDLIMSGINPPILHLDSSSIKTLRDMSDKNKNKPLLFSQQNKKLNILQQLLNDRADITFSNNDEDVNFWLNKDKKMTENILYQICLTFLGYRTQEKTINMAHPPFSRKSNPFYLTMQYRTFLLHITATQPLAYTMPTTIKRLIHEYKTKDTVTPKTTTTEPTLMELEKEERILFEALPYNTQQMVMDIFLYHDKSDSLIASK